MIPNEYQALLKQPDLAFVDAIETEAFQSMLEKDFEFYAVLDESLQWRLLYGLWAVLLDFADDPGSPWMPSMLTVPGLPGSFSLEDVLQALVVADFDTSYISWQEEPGFDSDIDEHVYTTALHSQGCRELVEHQIEAGLKRVLACDFSPVPAKVVERKPGLFRKVLAALLRLFDNRMPQLK